MSAIYDRSQKIVFLHPTKSQNGLILKNSVILKNTQTELVKTFTPKTLIAEERVQTREPLQSLREEIECRKKEFRNLEEAQIRVQFMLGELEKILKRKK